MKATFRRFLLVATLALVALLALGRPAPARADEGGAEDELVVTATRCREAAFTVDRSVRTVGPNKLAECQASTLPEALGETAGAHVQMTNRGAGAPILRGLVGPQNLIVVDGIRFNNSTFRTGPNQYLSLLDLSAADRIELVLGPGSVLYGSDAMGGVVQVFPVGWPAAPGFGARGGARFASADLATALWAEASWQNERLQILAGGAFRRFDTLRAGGGVMQPISDYLQGAWHARARVWLREDMELGVTYLAARIRDAGREDRLYEGRFRWYDNDDDLLYLDWRWRPEGGSSVLRELRVAPSFHRTHERVERFRCALPDDPRSGDAALCLGAGEAIRDAGRAGTPGDPLHRQEVDVDTVLTAGVLATAELAFWERRIRSIVGLEAYFDFVQSGGEERRGDADPAWAWKKRARGNFSDDSTYRSVGAFLRVEGDLLPWGAHRLILALGGRVAHFAAEAPDVPGLGDVSYDHTGFVGEASLRYLFEDRAMAYFTYSQGFRAPNLQESTVLGDTGSKFEVPNGALAPEKSHTLELGARVHWSPVRLHVAGFVSFLRDVIDERELSEAEWRVLGLDASAVGDKPVVQRVNAARGLYYGVEGTVSVGPLWRLTPWVRLSWMWGEIETGAGGTHPARRIPPLTGAVGLRYDHPDESWYVELFSRFALRQDRLHPSDEDDLRICEDPGNLGDTYADSGGGCGGTPGWFTLGVRGGYVFSPHLRLEAALTNLLDARYHIHGSGVDRPGVGASVTLTGSY